MRSLFNIVEIVPSIGELQQAFSPGNSKENLKLNSCKSIHRPIFGVRFYFRWKVKTNCI